MPKEQPRLTEKSPCAASSKNAKDKRNSTTLSAVCDAKGADDSGGRGSHCSSEKDSGYSDGSDWQQTDVEDQRTDISQSRGSERDEPSHPGQNQKPGQGNPGNPTITSSGHELYVIKNMVLKQLLSSSSLPHQTNMIPKRGQHLWRNGSRETRTSGAPHVILLQQPSLLPATVKLHKPLSRHSVTGKKSYPRIAPHPCKKPLDKSSLPEESHNLSEKACTEHKIDDKPVIRSDQHLFTPPKLAMSASSTTVSQSSSTSTACSSLRQGSHSVSSMHSTPSFIANRRLHRNSTASVRHRRFLSTVGILRQSGLLDITLRTKELLRQSSDIERDIAQLRQHTELLCQAAVSHSHNVTAWEHLYQAMAESGSYPDLSLQQNVQFQTRPTCAVQPDSISISHTSRNGGAENSGVSPSYFFTSILGPNQKCPISPQSHSQQGREFETGDTFSENVTLMPPDSSTD